MAIFGSKTKKTMEKKSARAQERKSASSTELKVLSKDNSGSGTQNSVLGTQNSSVHVIIRPRVTEKSGILSQGGVYTFEVARGANKQSIALAVKALYKVTPTKIGIINQPSHKIFVRGKRGIVPGFRKAIVTVKKGDKIDFV